jgi:hypothetical protein
VGEGGGGGELTCRASPIFPSTMMSHVSSKRQKVRSSLRARSFLATSTWEDGEGRWGEARSAKGRGKGP